MRRAHILAAALALALPALPAAAQAPDLDQVFKSWDKNGDGVLTKDEWLAAGRREEGFARVDADHDGKVTPAELKDAIARLRQRGG